MTYTTTQDSPADFVVNGRFRVQQITGVQRYASEIVSRLPANVPVLTPASGKGVVGHAWEQMVLPLLCHGRLLWNPNACGPLTYGRQVVTFHDVFPIEFPQWYSKTYSNWYGIVMRRLAAQAMHLIAVSEYTKSRLVKLFDVDPSRITVIHNGCHVNSPATPAQIDACRSALHLPSRRYVLSLSSMERRKNTAAILQAWAAIQDRLPNDVWLVLAGSPADASVYGKQMADIRPPRVFYTGYVPEQHLNALYSGASLFVFPSLAEGFGFPLLEAMASGVRCITSHTSSLREVGGDLVDYVDPTDPAQLAALIEQRLSSTDVPTEPFQPGIDRARSFSWDTSAHRTSQVLSLALAAQPQPMLPRTV